MSQITIDDIKSLDEKDITLEKMIFIAKQSAVYFMTLPSKLMTEDVLITVLREQPLLASIIPDSMITKRMLKESITTSYTLVRRAPKLAFDQELSVSLVDSDIDNYPFIDSVHIASEKVIEILNQHPQYIQYTDPSHITHENMAKLDDLTQLRPHTKKADYSVQLALCLVSPEMLLFGLTLNNEDLLRLLPLTDSEEVKLHIMNVLGRE